MILPLSLSLIFFILAGIHYNRGFGGKFGFAEALPTKENGERILNPRKIDRTIIDIGLSAFAFFYLLRSGLVEYNMPEWVLRYAGWLIPAIFILRVLGDFKYVGFFKRVKNTDFGKMGYEIIFAPVPVNSNFSDHDPTELM